MIEFIPPKIFFGSVTIFRKQHQQTVSQYEQNTQNGTTLDRRLDHEKLVNGPQEAQDRFFTAKPLRLMYNNGHNSFLKIFMQTNCKYPVAGYPTLFDTI